MDLEHDAMQPFGIADGKTPSRSGKLSCSIAWGSLAITDAWMRDSS
jgi:hypothetical protein